MAPSADSRRRRTRWILVGTFVVFMAPILVAYWLNVNHPGWQPFGTSNQGELIKPPRIVQTAGLESGDGGALPAALLRERWTILQVAAADCDAVCDTVADRIARGHRSLGKDFDRVVRVFVRAGRSAPLPEHGAGAVDAIAADATWTSQFDSLVNDAGVPFYFVLDPQGYVILRYAGPEDVKGLFKDLKRLLKISKIG